MYVKLSLSDAIKKLTTKGKVTLGTGYVNLCWNLWSCAKCNDV